MSDGLAPDVLNQLAASLEEARATRTPIAPLTASYPDLSVDEAYEIQAAQISTRIDGGAAIKGYKVGLTSEAMQRQLHVDQPDFGYLLDDMFHSDHASISLLNLLQPRVEPELAFVLGSTLSGSAITVAEAVSAVAYVMPALEIIDSRIRDWDIRLPDTIADNASSGAVVLGGRPAPITELDLRTVGCNLYENGEIRETGAGGAVLGSPLNALVWLANTLGRRGVDLQVGRVVLPGSITRAISVRHGSHVTAEFAGLGTVSASFVGAPS